MSLLNKIRKIPTNKKPNWDVLLKAIGGLFLEPPIIKRILSVLCSSVSLKIGFGKYVWTEVYVA